MFCKKCGKEIKDDTIYCPNCGEKVGSTYDRDSVEHPYTDHEVHPNGSQVYSNSSGNKTYDNFAIAGFVLSFFIPILGLIFSCIAYSNIKKTGNGSKAGLAQAGIIISVIVIGIHMFISFLAQMNNMFTSQDYWQNYINLLF